MLEVISASDNSDAARRELIQLIDITAAGANGVLELQVGMYTQQEAQRARAERDAERARLESP